MGWLQPPHRIADPDTDAMYDREFNDLALTEGRKQPVPSPAVTSGRAAEAPIPPRPPQPAGGPDVFDPADLYTAVRAALNHPRCPTDLAPRLLSVKTLLDFPKGPRK